MSEQLGKIHKPEAERFRRGKKLYLVPLIYTSDAAPDEYKEKHARYWRQVAEHLSNLTSKIGRVNRVYHESVFQAGEEGIKAVQRLNQSSHEIARTCCDNGATFEPIEERELLEEVMDWQRCLMLGFISEKVERTVFEFYLEAAKKRHELMARTLSETLAEDEAGLLFIREGHSVQFPADIEVFSVFPPALDELHRWHRDQAAVETTTPAQERKEKTGRKDREAPKRTRKRAKRAPKE